jgi:hypothetical protein
MHPEDDRREHLKPLAEITCPDPRSRGSGFFGTPPTFTEKGLEDHYAQLVDLRLHEVVPRDIWEHFETARTVYLYSWYAYRLIHVAELPALASLELALRERLKPGGKPPGLGRLLGTAVEAGLIQDRDLRRWQRSQKARDKARLQQEMIDEGFRRVIGDPNWNSEQASDPPSAPADPQGFVKRLAKGLPKYRNELAHGSFRLTPEGTAVLELCCDLINQLWPRRLAD